MQQHTWKAGRFSLNWSTGRPLIMGILNATPDSFSDGGRFNQVSAAIAHAKLMLDEGANILDIGAESTRPGAQSIGADEEWLRLEPILKELVRWNVPLSVDTMKAAVMRRCVDLGVDVLNDVYGFREEGAEAVLASSSAGAVVMHMQGEPRTMQSAPSYVDVVDEVKNFLLGRVHRLEALGVDSSRILVDPGFGFGKSQAHNVSLMKATRLFSTMANGVLIGVSRKRMIGEFTGEVDPSRRVHGSVAAAIFAAQHGAAVVRVHDVKATRDGIATYAALMTAE